MFPHGHRKHRCDMAYLTKLGFQAYVEDSYKGKDVNGRTQQAWFEGFAHGLNETGMLSDEELEQSLDFCSQFFRDKIYWTP